MKVFTEFHELVCQPNRDQGMLHWLPVSMKIQVQFLKVGNTIQLISTQSSIEVR